MRIENINESNFDDKIKNRGSVAVVDFYADWCGPCKMLSPILEDIASEYLDIDFFKVNVDENPNLSRTYGIMSIPTLVLFKEGKPENTLIGFKSRNDIINTIEELQK